MSSPEFDAWWKNFKVTGDICPVRLGMKRDEVKAILGEPDDVSTLSRSERIPAVYKYKELEFHFGLGDKGPHAGLSLIYSEVNDIPSTSIVYGNRP